MSADNSDAATGTVTIRFDRPEADNAKVRLFVGSAMPRTACRACFPPVAVCALHPTACFPLSPLAAALAQSAMPKAYHKPFGPTPHPAVCTGLLLCADQVLPGRRPCGPDVQWRLHHAHHNSRHGEAGPHSEIDVAASCPRAPLL